MVDLWKMNCDENRGVYLHFASAVHPRLKTEIKCFLRWIRRRYIFPKKLNITIFAEEYIYTFGKNEEVTASIYFPDCKTNNPLIRVATGDFLAIESEKGYTNAVCSILASIAHEITHYFQWVKNPDSDFSENQASRKAVSIVNKYLDDGYVSEQSRGNQNFG